MCSENELKEAVKVVQMGMSLCYVSEFFYGILKSTLVDKVSGHTSLNKKKGPEPMLSRILRTESQSGLQQWPGLAMAR